MDINVIKINEISHSNFLFIEQNLDIHSIIKNERVFRLDFTYFESLDLILRVSNYVINLFNKNTFDCIFINLVDNYILDIISQLASVFNIPVVSLAGNSFNSKYLTVTARGELNKIRKVNNDEVDEFIKNLTDRKLQPYNLHKKRVYFNLVRDYLRYKIKYIIHYKISFKLLGKLNYRYISTKAAAYPKSLTDIFYAFNIFENKLSNLSIEHGNTVYIPLHYHPEATTEYWIRNNSYLTYYPSLIKITNYYSEKGYTVLIKEHTSMLFKRDSSIYKLLKEINGVTLLSPFINTFDVINVCDHTAIYTGTTGVEALLNGKKIVLTETDIYYNFENFIPKYNADIGNLNNYVFLDKNKVKEIIEGFIVFPT